MTNLNDEICELTTDELDAVAGGRLEWNNRSISFVTPTGDTIINRPR
jgi:hypothetical protein